MTAPDGTLDRAALGRIVFADPAALAGLEAIVHPAVRPRIVEAIDAAERDLAPAVVVEAIKLVEGGLADMCDEVWLVTCDPADQRRRLVGRGMAAADADQRIAAQARLVRRMRSRATRVLDTHGDEAAAEARAAAAFAAALGQGAGETPGDAPGEALGEAPGDADGLGVAGGADGSGPVPG